MVAHKKKSSKTGKKKTTGQKKKSKAISGSSFSETELRKFESVIRKIRKGRRGNKGKKVGITNMSSFMNLLHNASRERYYHRSGYGGYGGYRRRYGGYRRRYGGYANRMMANPYKYPSLIRDADVNHIWNATKLPKSKTKDGIITNLNQVYRQLVGFDLLKPATKLPIAERGSINVVGPDVAKQKKVEEPKEEPKGPYLMPSRPSKTPQIREAPQLPSRPSRAPPPVMEDEDSSSSEDEEEY